jgi:hypothetical protein
MNDNQTLNAARTQYGNPIQTYDDGYGPLFILRDSMGVQGIIRARTWEDAYSIAEDEFFPEASDTLDELMKEYNHTREHIKIIRPADGGPERPATPEDYPLSPVQFVRWETKETPAPIDPETGEPEPVFMENALFQEAYEFRPSGPNARDTYKHGIYAHDLNGEALDQTTQAELLTRYNIALDIATEPEEPEA